MRRHLILLTIVLAVAIPKVAGITCRTDAQKWQDAVCCERSCPKGWQSLPLIVLSFDGFWYKYLHRKETPTFDLLRCCGSSAPNMFPSYPSKTFPNHYTIVTGLYPESHGIIDNKMYDGRFPNPDDRVFSMKQTGKTNPWFLGEPIWNTASKNGMKSATLFWLGSDVIINGMRPTYYKTFSERTNFEDQIMQILKWLKMPTTQRPSIILSYFNEPDEAGHYHGPNSDQVNQQLVRIDRLVDRLMSDLFSAGLLHCVNLIITSDHGMKETLMNRVNIHQHLNTTGMRVFSGALGRIMLEESELTLENVEDKLRCKRWFRTYRRADAPKRYHYSRLPRIGDVLLDMNPGRMVWQHADKGWLPKGDHGYDNLAGSMRTIFMAVGPSFKKNYVTASFQNIQLYNLFADLIGITDRAANNGTEGALYDVLKYPPRPLAQPHAHKSARCNLSDFRSCAGCVLPQLPRFALHESAVSQIGPDRSDLCAISGADFRLLFNRRTDMPVMLQDWTCDRYNKAVAALEANDAGLFSLLASAHTAPDAAWESFYSRVPMYTAFYNEVWQPLMELLKNKVGYHSNVLTLLGPIFDHNSDGLADDVALITSRAAANFSMPTHYFSILIECPAGWRKSLTCKGLAKAKVFIFPHKKGIPCHAIFNTFAVAHVAAIRDVELLSGLSFLSNWNAEQAMKLKLDLTESIRLPLN